MKFVLVTKNVDGTNEGEDVLATRIASAVNFMFAHKYRVTVDTSDYAIIIEKKED